MSPVARRAQSRLGWTRFVVATAGLLAFGAVTGLIPFPNIGDLVADLSDALGAWAYALIPALVFFETAAFLGLLVPGETAVLVGGVVAERGEVSLPILVAAVWAAAFAGDLTAFLLGRRLGRPFLRRNASRLHIRVEHLNRVDDLFTHHGGKTIILGRFLGVLRAFTSFAAGASGMSLRRFVPYSLGAALAWTLVFTLLGYAFSRSINTVGSVVTQLTIAAALIAAAAAWIRRSRLLRAHYANELVDAADAPLEPASTS